MSKTSCDDLHRKLIKRLTNSSVPALKEASTKHCWEYQKQGAAYAFMASGATLALISAKAPNFKLHPPGMFAAVCLSCLLGSMMALSFNKHQILVDMGKIKEDPEADKMRDQAMRFCSKY